MAEVNPNTGNDCFFKTELDIISHGGDIPIIGSIEYAEISEQVYGSGWTQPLFRIDGRFVHPNPQMDVPPDTLALPESIIQDLGRETPAEDSLVLVATEQYAKEHLNI